MDGMEEKPGGLSDLKELPDSGFFVLSPGDFSPRAASEMPPRRSVGGSARPASAPGGSASQQEAARAQQQRVEQLQQQPPVTPPDEAERRRAKNAKKRAKKRTKKAAEKQQAAEEAAAAGPKEEQIKIVRELALNMRALSCGIVGSAFARLPAYLPAERAAEIREGIVAAQQQQQQHDSSSPDQIARIMEPLMGKAMAALTGDAELRQTFDGLLDEGIKERIPDDSTRCYVLLGIRVREAELVMQNAFPAKHKETLQTAHAEAEAARAAGTEEGEALADEILRAADAKVTKDGGGACKRPKPAFSGG